MATIEGAFADPSTRRALLRSIALAVAMFVVSVALVVIGLTRYIGTDRHQQDLVRDGKRVPALVLTVDQTVPGIDRVTFAYSTSEGRQRKTLVVFNSYERGQKVGAYVSRTDDTDAILAGETPESGWGWIFTVTAFLVGLVGIPLGARRLLRAARTWTVLRSHPWAPWTMRAVYPKRRRLAVATGEDAEEHLVRLDSWSARRLGKLPRKSPLFLAGSGRWFVVTPTEGKRIVALGRMDVPYERLGLVNPGARADRFDVQPDEDGNIPEPEEVF